MTAPLVDRSRAALARRADVAPRRDARPLPGRAAVLVAIVLGLVLGAMTCAAGLADGNGHAAHAAEGPFEPDRAIGSADHGSHAATPAPIGTGSDASTTPPAEGHPGMACLVPVDLRLPGPTVATSSDVCAVLGPSALADRTGDLDPPVPRSS